jgi:hypothetical protein
MRVLLLFLLISNFCFSQNFISKVVGMNNDLVKMETPIFISDSLITITASGQKINYTVKEKINQLYITELYGSLVKITVIETPGKAKGFKYTYSIGLLYQDNNLPPITYFSIKE